MQQPTKEDFSLKETTPRIAATDRPVSSSFSLVEQMHYLYIRVVKAKELFSENSNDSYYVELRLGNYKGTTNSIEKKPNPEWNQVFAFSKERIHSSFVEISIRGKKPDGDEFKGRVIYEVNEAPKRVPPDSSLAPQWYKLEGLRGESVRGELMLALWMGTQADEAFPEAWHSDAAGVAADGVINTKSKVYLSPKLWYLRVNVIGAQDLEPKDTNRRPEAFVRAVLGKMTMRTKISLTKTVNPLWNEDLMFVAAEPFEDQLVLSVEDRMGNKEERLGMCVIHLHTLERRLVHKPVDARWYNLEKPMPDGGEQRRDSGFNSKLHLRMSLDGGYHVLDESTHYSSDLRPTVKQLWKPGIGVLELGILNANGLPPMKRRDGRGTTDAYCVAKYGQKWVRTRTIIDSSSPQWNEQYTWEVFDPCTVITVGVFDNSLGQGSGGGGAGGPKDTKIGKIRIRLSTLETDRIYTHSYPLLVLQPQGLKKMGEIQLALRFSCSSFFNLLHAYCQPILPLMHYLHPLSIFQLDYLRYQATQIIAVRLSRAEPPLRKEVVEYMLDVGSNMWSTRRSKANFNRIKEVFSRIAVICKWFNHICSWKRPFLTIMIHILLLLLILYPQLILPTAFLYLFLVGVWNYRTRARNPPHMDTQLSYAELVRQDELEEEFDTFPTTKQGDSIKLRYDRLRGIAGKVQTVAGDLASQGERLQSLLNWRDPRATALFITFCLTASIIFYVTPFKLVVSSYVFYTLRHPKFRHNIPSAPLNFFRRLPAKTDCLL
ncbi:FT-interacting protein 3 [Ancistrocladus abbreviatus]